ncbi:hypothetical protein BSNK01_12110 [Bacillaceae bacterium]
MLKFWEMGVREVSFKDRGKEYSAILVGDDPNYASAWRIVGNGEEYTPTPEFIFGTVARKRSLKIEE